MWVEMLWIPAFAGMTEETDGLDKSSPYLDRRDACPTVLYGLLRAYNSTPLLLSVNL
jgi:hypothetical protein